MFTDKEGKPVSREVLIDRMHKHIAAVVGRYKGRIKGWDVVNETVEDNGEMRRSPYYNIIGPDYIELAFKFAHEADPDAELYINDYSMSKPGKRETTYRTRTQGEGNTRRCHRHAEPQRTRLSRPCGIREEHGRFCRLRCENHDDRARPEHAPES